MLQQATFPHSWFAEAGPSPNTQILSIAGPSQPLADRRSSVSSVDSDLDVTEDLLRRNSFDFILDTAKENESIALKSQPNTAGKQVTRPAPAAMTGHRASVNGAQKDNADGLNRNGTIITRAIAYTASAEAIELRDLPWHPVSQYSFKGPALPPLARLPRR